MTDTTDSKDLKEANPRLTETLDLLDLSTFKEKLGYNDEKYGSDDYDYKLMDIVETANRRLTLELRPYIGKVDFRGSDLWQDSAHCAFTYARALHHQRINHSNEGFELFKKEYDDQIRVLKKAIQVDRPNRTKLAIFSSDPNDDQLTLPSQKYDSILD